MKPSKAIFYISALLLLSNPAFAGQAKIVDVEATNNNGSYRFDVTLRHDDAGWDHSSCQ
jgi:hypothetical protein